MCNGVFVITLRKCGTNGRTRFVFIAPRVCFVGIGGIPTAGEDVTDVNFVGCGLAERTDTAPVIVYNNCCAVRNIIKNPLCIVAGKPDTAGGCEVAQFVVLLILQIVFMNRVIRHGMEKDAANNAGYILPVAGTHKGVPTVAFLGFEDAARCCITCGANHGKIGTGVVALFVNAINGNGVSRAIDADKIRITVFALDVKILIALGFFKFAHEFFSCVGIFCFNRVIGRIRIARGRRNSCRHRGRRRRRCFGHIGNSVRCRNGRFCGAGILGIIIRRFSRLKGRRNAADERRGRVAAAGTGTGCQTEDCGKRKNDTNDTFHKRNTSSVSLFE